MTTREEILAEITKVENNPAIIGPVKKARLKQLNDKLAALDSKPAAEPKKPEKKQEKRKYFVWDIVPSPDLEGVVYMAGDKGKKNGKTYQGRLFYDKETEKYSFSLPDGSTHEVPEKLIKKVKGSFYKKSAKEQKEPKAKKSNSKTTEKVYKGKKIKGLNEEDCKELLKDVRERRRKQKSSEKRSKSKPVIEKVAKHVATAVKQAVDNVSAEDIKDDPKGEISKMEKVANLAKKFLQDLRAILGEDYDKEAINEEMKEVHDMIAGIKKKYGK